jgi:nucleoside-diphosphate-sugar epimerase
MIIGNGDIAHALKKVDRKDLLFFASGVSNSKEDRGSEFDREINLLLDQNTKKHIVYFSSLSLFYPNFPNTPYIRHKKKMERTIKEVFPKYTIVRLGNITWGKNPHTLLNHFRNKFKKDGLGNLKIQNTYRYLIDKKEFIYWMKLIPDWNCEMNIPGRMLKVKEIVSDLIREYGYALSHTGKI